MSTTAERVAAAAPDKLGPSPSFDEAKAFIRQSVEAELAMQPGLSLVGILKLLVTVIEAAIPFVPPDVAAYLKMAVAVLKAVIEMLEG